MKKKINVMDAVKKQQDDGSFKWWGWEQHGERMSFLSKEGLISAMKHTSPSILMGLYELADIKTDGESIYFVAGYDLCVSKRKKGGKA